MSKFRLLLDENGNTNWGQKVSTIESKTDKSQVLKITALLCSQLSLLAVVCHTTPRPSHCFKPAGPCTALLWTLSLQHLKYQRAGSWVELRCWTK